MSSLDAMNQPTGMDELRASTSVRLAETQDGAVLLDIQQGICFSLNLVGTMIWKQINDGRELEQIVHHLADTFSISPEQAKSDLGEFIAQLRGKQLLHDLNVTGQKPKTSRQFPWFWRSKRSNSTNLAG